MELFARCDRETERLLAVTEEGKRYTLGDLNAAAERIAGAVGEHRLVFVLCENTPGTLLGYLGCLKAGEVPLLLDAHIAPELLRGLLEMELPALNTLTQAGGKLPEALHLEFADWAARTGRRFFVMYGQTEAAPRMGYLPAERAVEKCGSMGVPVPGGQFRLLGEDGAPIDAPDTVGELVYRGPNVAMGYARRAEELALGDEWHGELHTGDMARRDGDGFYYIVGRKKRFIKLYGNRVGLDEVERLLAVRFPDTGFACVGRDDLLRIFHDSADPAMTGAAAEYLSEQMHFPERVFQIRALEAIPKNEAGKTQYRAREEMR